METLPHVFGYSLPQIHITTDQQQEIIRLVKELYDHGIIKASHYTSKDYTGDPFIYALALRSAYINGERVPSMMLNRFDEADWKWDMDNCIVAPVAKIVQQVVKPLLPYYKRMTRCVILLQIPGQEVPYHVDYHPHNEDGHNANHHYSLKFPLTEVPGNNGTPTLRIGGKEYRYETGTCAFLLNEVDIEHGSKASEFTRGVIFIDGVFEFSKLDRIQHSSISLEELPS